MKIDRRIAYHLVLDVETAGNLSNPLVYDIGFVITDRQGRIYEKRSYMIREIWENKALMLSSYYAKKIPVYEKDIQQGKRVVVPFREMRKEMFRLMRKYNVKYIGAYNLEFDMKALGSTSSFLVGQPVKFLTEEFKDVKLNCIWSLACQVLYTQKAYRNFCVDNGFVSKAGNFQTTAEIGYRFITDDVDFIESHTGLEDVLIETEIMAYSYRQNKKHKKGIVSQPWRIPQV